MVNPVGFLFEAYDQAGAVREEEIVFDDDGAIIGTFPVDTRVEDPRIEDGGPEVLEDSIELASVLATSPKAQACMAQRLFEYMRRTVPDNDIDACTLSEVTVLGRDGSLLDAIAASIGNEDVLWRKVTR